MLRRRFGCPLSRVSCSPSSSTLSTRGDSVRFSRRSGATYSSVPEDSSGVVRMPTYRRSTNRPFDVFTLASSCISRATFQADSSAAPSAAAATPCARAAASRTARALPPKVIEVEPVVGRDTAVVLQPSHIASQQRLDCAIAGANALFARRGETLDVDVVAVRTAVDAEEQQHGPILDDADANRPGGEERRPAQEFTAHFSPFAEGTVRQHADDFAALERGLHLQHGIEAAERNDVVVEARIDAPQDGSHFARVFLVHQHADPQSLRPAERARNLGAAEVRAEDHAAFSLGHRLFQDIARPRLAAEHPAEILARSRARARRERDEVEADGIEQEPRRAPPDHPRHPDDHAQRERVAALGPVHPVGLVHLARYACVDGSGHDILPASTILPSTAQLKLISPPLRENSITTRSPGRAGRRNFAEEIEKGARGAPMLRSIAWMASLSSTAPGMMGLPSKCPREEGWSGRKTRSTTPRRGAAALTGRRRSA